MLKKKAKLVIQDIAATVRTLDMTELSSVQGGKIGTIINPNIGGTTSDTADTDTGTPRDI
jgi:hypothetical protein